MKGTLTLEQRRGNRTDGRESLIERDVLDLRVQDTGNPEVGLLYEGDITPLVMINAVMWM